MVRVSPSGDEQFILKSKLVHLPSVDRIFDHNIELSHFEYMRMLGTKYLQGIWMVNDLLRRQV